jgi:hypothetical protein
LDATQLNEDKTQKSFVKKIVSPRKEGRKERKEEDKNSFKKWV